MDDFILASFDTCKLEVSIYCIISESSIINADEYQFAIALDFESVGIINYYEVQINTFYAVINGTAVIIEVDDDLLSLIVYANSKAIELVFYVTNTAPILDAIVFIHYCEDIDCDVQSEKYLFLSSDVNEENSCRIIIADEPVQAPTYLPTLMSNLMSTSIPTVYHPSMEMDGAILHVSGVEK